MDGSEANRPYHAKKPHRKSRSGCRNCKTRKVKCDESRPTCRACRLRRETCVYPLATTSSPPKSLSPVSAPSVPALSASPPQETWDAVVPVQEPLFIPAHHDATNLRLLWHYSNYTWSSLSTRSGKEPQIDYILKVSMLEQASNNPWLMNGLLAFTAMHMKFLGQDAPDTRIALYRANAFEGYRKAIEEADPATFPALLYGSLLLCGVSSSMFRYDEAQPLYVLDWLLVWRGIGLMIQLVTRETLYKTGIEKLFFRPKFDGATSAMSVPSNLLFMATSIRPDDDDFPAVDTLYSALKLLGSLYRELESGLSPTLNLRIITFPTFLPQEFISLARKKRPRAVAIVAYYLAFTKLVKGIWWVTDIADKEITNIADLLGPKYDSLLRIPKAVIPLSDPKDITRLLINNHAWQPTEVDELRLDELALVPNDPEDNAPLIIGNFPYQIPREEPSWYK
ncbi:hypothetical protein B0H67DRAFT_372533 [Lasiosphaeris hirsuta]|uniref:Zn(2)-C6 fungal-type domain-containing protein n=1 Tax=Lasiosphaeris hirsuta TaxID=260670 RepID=A0AA40DMD0_9PEZI|nr:hypothetical protein B0H67DRAFT_372533 [Lasiosphaeris hirsuta]